MNIFKRLCILSVLLFFVFSSNRESFARECYSTDHSLEPHSLVIYPQNTNIAYDTQSNQYFIRDLQMFPGIYPDKIQQINNLNNISLYASPYWGIWSIDSNCMMSSYCFYDVEEVFGNVGENVASINGISQQWSTYNEQYDMISTCRIVHPFFVSDIMPNEPISTDFSRGFGVWVTADAIADPHLSQVKINIEPASAVTAGAKWSLDGIVWHNSGETTWAFPATYTVIFSELTGLVTPKMRFSLAEDASISGTATYQEIDTVPDKFAFSDQGNVPANKLITSDTITITGINVATSIAISGGECSINDGSYSAANASVRNGDKVKVRVRSSSMFSSAVNATLTIGGVSDTFSVKTEAERKDISITSYNCNSSTLNRLTGVTTVTQCMTIKNTGNVPLSGLSAIIVRLPAGVTAIDRNLSWKGVLQPGSSIQSYDTFKYSYRRGRTVDLTNIFWDIQFPSDGCGNDYLLRNLPR